jgi:hypothetical protein
LKLCHFALRIEPQYPLSRRLDGTSIQSGQFEQEKDLFPLLEFESQVVQPVNTECAMSVTSLLSPAYKITSSIPPSRLNMLVDEIIGDSRCSFWTNKSISDHIFSLYEIRVEKQ